MNTLTSNRIIQKGDEYKANGAWKPIPDEDFGLQVLYTKYAEVRRPSEKPFPVPNGSSNESHPAPTRAKVQTSEGAKVGDRTHSDAGETLPNPPPIETVVPCFPDKATQKAQAAEAFEISPDSGKSVKAVSVAKAERETKTPAPTPSGAGVTPFTEREIATAKSTLKTSIKIDFPPVSAGSGNTVPIWTGRNGTFSGYALDAMVVDNNIMLSPVGKRGVGNCTIQFPISVIPELVDWLNEQTK